MPKQPKPPPSHLQAVEDVDWSLDVAPEAWEVIKAQRELTQIAWRQLGAEANYCQPRGAIPLETGEEFCHTDEELRLWIDAPRRRKLNAAVTLHQGVVEARVFGPDSSLAECFFQACRKLELAPRYAIGRASRPVASSILFKLRDDEAKRLEEEYASFKPKPFAIDGARRGVIFNYAPPIKRNLPAPRRTVTLFPGSLIWHENGTDYDLMVWRQENGQGEAARWQTAPPKVEYFQIVRAAAFASILNLVTRQAWLEYPVRRSLCEWLARVVREGRAINENVVFSKASRAVVSEPKHAETLIALLAEGKDAAETREESLDLFKMAARRLDADPTRFDVAGWSVIRERFGEETHKALRAILNVGADSSLLEDLAERYLFCEGQFIDRAAFKEGREQFIFPKDVLMLRHAPDQIQTKKKPVAAFPLFVASKLRQDVTGLELHPDKGPGVILRVTRQGAIVADDDYAPEHSRLVFNEWAGLYITPAKTVEAALEQECKDKLDHMLSLVTNNRPERAAWIKAHFGWTLKHPGLKQQVALVCTGDQGTGKTFLCHDFAQAVFGRYAGKGSVKALEGQFYVPSYVRRLWVNHDEVVSKEDTIEIIKDLIRSTKISGEFKGRDVATYTTYARLAFTSNEANPGLSRSGVDRGFFQVTSITAESEGLMPTEFQERMNREVKPFYKAYHAFLEREEARQAYVRMLIDCAPDTIAEVEDLTHSAMRDLDVAAKHLTREQLVAKAVIESGTITGDTDISMPFGPSQYRVRCAKIASELGIRLINAEAVVELWIEAGVLARPSDSSTHLFKFKYGMLLQEFGKFLGVKLYSSWELDPNDFMPNDWRTGDPTIPWRGRKRRE